ncbi:sigma-70 family RNA polymerase sigma factor [Lachnospiraceae bacterium ZAX-1]
MKINETYRLKKYSQLFFKNFGKTQFSNGIGSERENKPPFVVMEGGEDLELSFQETIKHQFESYCKKIIRERYRDCVRSAQRLSEHEISFSELSQNEMDSLSVRDDYAADYFHFDASGIDVPIKSESLANALSKLPPQKRDIVLLAHCLGMSDVEIAEMLNMIRSTVQYQRTSSLAKLKKYMEG